MANDVSAFAERRGAAPGGMTCAESLAESLRRVAQGDRGAFEAVYQRTASKLFGVCLTILPARPEAEDALQDVYFAVWRSAASFDEKRGTAMTWLITMARNRSVDRRRRSGSAFMAPIEWASTIADPRPLASELIESDEEHRKMRYCLTLLSERDGTALKMAFLGGATYADLALAAAIPVGTMKSRMRRALAQLRVGMS